MRFFFRTAAAFSRRSFSFTPSSIAKFPFRLVLGAGSAGLGYAAYKINEAKEWLDEKSTLIWRLIPSPKPKSKESRSKDTNSSSSSKDNSFSSPLLDALLIKRMIEVRNLLKIANSNSDSPESSLSASVELPTIVVIGSQSSGKSSLLESLVGREFLPKGSSAMTTKRPLEITLVHLADPQAQDYALFPQLPSAGPITDFGQVKQTLAELNNAVPQGAWVSPQPVELFIYSSRVPDLSLVDLPGYIALSNRNQPPELRDQISALCQKYIAPKQPANIILAVSAADVDLANSEALKASRTVDPMGDRTIGVITKIDLVPGDVALRVLTSEDYPLKLGYIGVVCRKFNASGSIEDDSQERSLRQIIEDSRFAEYRSRLGIPALQQKLLQALERVMSGALQGASEKVQSQLEDAAYRFKVLYNDKPISMEGYVAFLSNCLKDRLRELAGKFTRPWIEGQISTQLEGKLVDLLWGTFWNVGLESSPSSVINVASQLTKCGIGKISTDVITVALKQEISRILQSPPLSHHQALKETLVDGKGGALEERVSQVCSLIENAIKPLKVQPEFTVPEWERARTRAISMIKREIATRETCALSIARRIGQKRLYAVIQQLALPAKEEESSSIGQGLKEKALEAALLNHQIRLLRSRLALIQSPECKVPEALSKSNPLHRMFSFFSSRSYAKRPNNSPNYPLVFEKTPDRGLLIQSDPCCYTCPEIYLHLLADKLSRLSSALVHFEVVQDYLNPSPTDYADRYSSLQTGASFFSKLLRNSVNLKAFVSENAGCREHLELQERLEALRAARAKLAMLVGEKGNGEFTVESEQMN